jgi:hypothetical protein
MLSAWRAKHQGEVRVTCECVRAATNIPSKYKETARLSTTACVLWTVRAYAGTSGSCNMIGSPRACMFSWRTAQSIISISGRNVPRLFVFVLFCSAYVARACQKQSVAGKKRASLVQSGLLDEARRNVGMGGRHRFLRLLHVGIGRTPVQQSALRPERPQWGSLRSLCVSPLSPLSAKHANAR